jgi:hypothetical protein
MEDQHPEKIVGVCIKNFLGKRRIPQNHLAPSTGTGIILFTAAPGTNL